MSERKRIKYKLHDPVDTKLSPVSTPEMSPQTRIPNRAAIISPSLLSSISSRSSGDSGIIRNHPLTQLTYHPEKSCGKFTGSIPFHIPHKRVLEKIEFKKELPQPLTDFDECQFQLQGRKLPALDPVIRQKLFSQTKATSDHSQIQRIVTMQESAKQKERLSVSGFPGKPKLEHLRRRKKPDDIADQMELIRSIKEKPEFNFFYMIYAVDPSSEYYGPYCLKVVPYSQLDKSNFLTISSQGVTQYYSDEMYFTPLTQWQHEYEMYEKVQKLKLFSLYRQWKAFFVWRKNILFETLTECETSLEKTLVILIPALRDAALAVQSMCVKLLESNFTYTVVKEDFLLYYFVNDQYNQTTFIKTKLEEFKSLTVQLILTACYGTLKAAGFTIDDSHLRPSQTMAASSGRHTKDGHLKMSYTEQARKKRTCKRISSFIGLMDFLTLNMLHNLTSNSLRDLLQILQEQIQYLPENPNGTDLDEVFEIERSGKPLFKYELILEPDRLYFDPSEALTFEAFQDILEYWSDIVNNIEPFLKNSIYNPFIMPLINGKVEERTIGYGPSLRTVIADNRRMVQMREQLFAGLRKTWDTLYAYVERFQPVVTAFTEDCGVDREVIKNERSLHNFREWLETFNGQIQEINKIVDSQIIGPIFLKIDGIKKTALPQPTNLIRVIEKVLPKIGHDQLSEIMSLIENYNTYLDHEPMVTQEYVEYLTFLNDVTIKIDQMESDLDYVKELYDLTDEYKISVPREDTENYMNCGTLINKLRNNAEQRIDSREKITDKLGEAIAHDIEVLVEEVTNYNRDLQRPWLIDVNSDPESVLKTLNEVENALKECQEKVRSFKNIQKLHKLEVTRFDMLDEALNKARLIKLLWSTLQTWQSTVDGWFNAELKNVDPEEIADAVVKNIKNVAALERGLPPNNILPALKEKVETIKDKLPVIQYLRNPALRNRHWMQIETILKHKFKPDEQITLKSLQALHCFNYATELMEVSGQASSEAALEGLLKKVEDNWKGLEFNIVGYKDKKDVFIIGSVEEIQAVLDDSFITINTIATSRHVGPIKPRVDEWLGKLNLFSKTLEEWLQTQQQWLYLEVIFSAPDIQRQLPAEAKMFATVDKQWKEIMRRTSKVPLAMQAATAPGVLESFQKSNQLLDQIMKCLEAYLEVKRVSFPRFYFLSNEELLEILAQTRNPHAVQPHLRKCFDAIAKLEFGTKIVNAETEPEEVATNDILAMISPEGEKVALGKGLKARGNVEDWLSRVEDAMFAQLRRLMKSAIVDYQEQERKDWLMTHPNQIILIVSQIMWARKVHKILDPKSNTNKQYQMFQFEKENVSRLNELATIVRGDLDPVVRKIIIALITIDVHARDTISILVQKQIESSDDFEWLKMLRYYWDKTIDNCLARMSNSSYVYGYEYLGAGGCLVITPLTDRCYLCLMGALQLDLGGAPAGPAGTGKTETTKDLAKSLAIQCIVFNCSEGLDFKMMGRFFSGLAQSGAWCCFDEFNRIDIEVLSVIAQQLITIRNAKAAGLKRFMFEGKEIKLVRQCAAFITMNPGYAGRTELPDNLKAVFRPISMMVPDYKLIAEVTLYSEGFVSSKLLARKMVQMYKLCSEQLSQQDHYDFGMRAVKSVLVMAGALKRANPDTSEDITLIRALKDANLPKFLSDDTVLFMGILGDLFPAVVLPEPDYGEFQNAITFCQTEMGLQPEPAQIRKVIQLHETMIVRWGVMLVGPTGGGKSTVLKILGNSLTKMYNDGFKNPSYQPVKTFTINPKAVTIGELYGEVDLTTMEWHDGLLAIAVRSAVNSQHQHHQWVVCDGPVDAVWIENLNTVLDDNKMLCLANSERIKLTPYVHMVFEVEDLSQASPATVSRCGMVYVDPGSLRWKPYLTTWLARTEDIPEDIKNEVMEEAFGVYIGKAFHFVKKFCHPVILQVEISKITMMCNIMQSLITEADKNLDKFRYKQYFYQIFTFALLWSLGGNLTAESRLKFELYLREELLSEFEAAKLPTTDFWNIYINTEMRNLDNWAKLMPEFQYDKTVPFFDILVPTVDTVRFGYLMECLVRVNAPVMFTGETGVGKSVIAKEVLKSLSEGGSWLSCVLNFSAQTSSLRTQEMIETKLERKRKNLLGAPSGKRMLVFVDDVNMPKLEKYGAQPPIELLRQYLDYGGLYDRKKLFWKKIVDVIVSIACAPPGGGRNPLPARFVRHFAMFAIPAPNETSLKVIFAAILKGFFADFVKDIQALAIPVVTAAIDLYLRIETDLLPTPDKSHYLFNLRDLSKCVQGVLQADSSMVREPRMMHRLFYHECLRVFSDRLIDINDKSYFYHLMNDICLRRFGTSVLTIPDDTILRELPTLLFGDFMIPSAAKEDRVYEEITDLKKLESILLDYLDDFNLSAKKPLQLIFFSDCLLYCTILSRIFRAQRGNALLVGVGGMGKRSVVKIASHVNFSKVMQIELTRNYDHNAFFEDLRKMYFHAGGLNNQTTFLFNDTEIVQEEFLEDVNNVLNSGDVANLFQGDEFEKVIMAVTPQAKQVGQAGTRDLIYNYFIGKVRSNLHLALCMSPIGDAFRRRCRMFPSLVNCCTIVWFSKWPSEALFSVAQQELKNSIEDQSLIGQLATICVSMHESVEEMTSRYYLEMRRRYYTTPSSYLDMLKLYKFLLNKKNSEIQQSRERIANGLNKLLETNRVVVTMRADIEKMEPLIKKKNESVAELVKTVSKQQVEADKIRTVVQSDEAAAKEKASQCQNLAEEAQADLDKAMPAMEAAANALNSLNKADINELRVFTKPPKMVQWVMEPVCILLGQKTDWDTCKKIMGGNFLKTLTDYDKNNIPDKILKQLVPYLKDPKFVPDKVAAVSKVLRSMCMWVIAIDSYAKVYREVGPKIKKQQEAERELQEVNNILAGKQKLLANIEAQVAALQKHYQDAVDELTEIQRMIALTAKRLINAGRLTLALSDEQERWEVSVKNFGTQLTNLVGDILVASASVAYLGAFTLTYRTELVTSWITLLKYLGVPSSPSYNLITVLADPYEIRIWNTCGLPKDAVSTENAIFATRSSRWPLMIDPQEQASRWIRALEGPSGLKVTKSTDANYMRIIEAAIRIGMPVLLEEVGEVLDPTLTPILKKMITAQGGRLIIHLGDTDVDYDDNFRFYLTTKLSNPHYLPDVCIMVTLVNFTVTPTGLEDQLLSDVVGLERPDLEKQRTECIVRINEDKNQLKMIEDKILRLLFASTGNILDDEELIETLNESKETSAVIESRLIDGEKTETKITEAREKYRSVAIRGSIIFFVVAQLLEIDPMYQFSLKYFNNLVVTAIETSKKAEDLFTRLSILYQEITLALYTNISRGLFERHKLIFSFLLCANIVMKAGEVSEAEWSYLIRGPIGSKGTRTKPAGVGARIWANVEYLENTWPNFEGLGVDCLRKIDIEIGDYKEIINLIPGNKEKGIKVWNKELTDFEKLMLVKALCEEKLVFFISAYVRVHLGPAFTESPQITLNLLYKDISNTIPLVFVLSTGSDPFNSLLRFAAEMGFMEKLQSISLGQGQGPIAERMIEKARVHGDWIFLQNCHLATSWMLNMERALQKLTERGAKVHPDFRLFLSSMPSKAFPVSVLQNSVKVTNEPPKGLRSNLKRAFMDIDPDGFEKHALGTDWRSIVFGICLFHAVIQERKKFGPLGWNIIYEFNDSDRECALLNFKMFCEVGYIPWDALEYITGEITYGGRVTDNWDLRCLKTILKGFFSEAILEPNYKYSQSGTYFCPRGSLLLEFQNYIDSLPLIEAPEIFGMHENANIAFQIKESKQILDTILMSQPQAGGKSEGKSANDIVLDLATTIQESILKKIETDKGFEPLFKEDDQGRVPPLTTMLTQETDRFNKLLSIIHSSIVSLKMAIKGLVVMSETLEEVYTAFLNNQIPLLWTRSAYPSLKSLGSWTLDLQLRLDFISNWLHFGKPDSIWISGFFFPQGFLTGCLQTHARKYQLPIDALMFDFEVTSVLINQEQIKKIHDEAKRNDAIYGNLPKIGDGAIIHGLYLDAGRWDFKQKVLADPNPGEMNSTFPAMVLIPTTTMPENDTRYVSPLYKTSVRAGTLSTTGHSTNFVIAVLIPSKENQSYWILKGTALLTQITD